MTWGEERPASSVTSVNDIVTRPVSTISVSAAGLGKGFIIGFEHQSLLGENYILIVVLLKIQKLDSDLFVSENPTPPPPQPSL